nr:hypothetical protein [Mimivirus sp.]
MIHLMYVKEAQDLRLQENQTIGQKVRIIDQVFTTIIGFHQGVIIILGAIDLDLLPETDIISEKGLLPETDLISEKDHLPETDIISVKDHLPETDLISVKDHLPETDLIRGLNLLPETNLIKDPGHHLEILMLSKISLLMITED